MIHNKASQLEAQFSEVATTCTSSWNQQELLAPEILQVNSLLQLAKSWLILALSTRASELLYFSFYACCLCLVLQCAYPV